ncbi:hypothetical protein ONZ45_g13690 [Pleurotus djamor]|nr:hypothetical protein ONZ45_g13690 [Pleurotus djamor]
MDDSFDSFTMPRLPSSSRLMSESPLLRSHSDTGPGGDDLSISELSISDRDELNMPRPFSLLARSERAPATPTREDEYNEGDSLEQGHEDDNDEEADETIDQEKIKRIMERSREDKLRSDVFILKKLNAAFAAFNEALEEAGLANERIASQLEDTDALLSQYMLMLSKSEDISRLIFDEEWQGSEADEALLEQERIAAEEQARKEAQERAHALQKEKERREREEREAMEAREKARIENERQAKLKGLREEVVRVLVQALEVEHLAQPRRAVPRDRQ